MSNSTPVSIVIVTKNRYLDLIHCLTSITAQSITPDEVLVIDNQSTDETAEVTKKFSRNVTFPIKHILEKKHGYPNVYNRGLFESKYQWVAFIDDDCIASADWLKSIKETIRNNPKVAAILGETLTYHQKNLYSQLYSFKERVWKQNAIKQMNILDLEILDNKNIVYNNLFLKNKKISFDTKFNKKYQGASEDCDMGMQIQQVGGNAVFQREMTAYHKDPTGFLEYYHKIIRITKGHALYEVKWKVIRSNNFPYNYKQAIKYLRNYIDFIDLSVVGKFLFIFYLTLTSVIVKSVKLHEKINIKKSGN